MSQYYMVDVKSITSKVSRSAFNVKKLEELAQSILAAGGLVSPLLLQQTDVESYEVLAGDLEYYAAVRAKELSPRTAEMVNAFVVSNEEAQSAIKQFNLVHISSTNKKSEIASQKSRNIGNGQIANLEARIDEFMQDFKSMQQQGMQTIDQRLSSLQEQLPSKVEALELFNHASTPELMQKMAKAGIKGKNAEKIINGIEKARKKSDFISLKDVIERVNGLAERRMLTMLDSWAGLY